MSICANCQAATEPTDKFCRNCGTPVAAAAAPEAKPEERRLLTVLFCDLVGSTQLSSQLDPEEMRELIQLYQAACSQEISRYGGYTAQFLGDGILVYFGYPTTSEDTAEQAVRCALAMRMAIQQLSEELKNTWGVTLAVRIGVHTGLVVIGEMGSGDRKENLALGEAPNIAARIQGHAEADEVLISDETRKLTRGRFLLSERGAPELKGVSQSLALFTAREAAFDVLRGDLASASIPIHGRDTELATLRRIAADSAQTAVQHVRIQGEAGAGKSHFLRAFLSERDEPVTEIFCSEHYSTTPLWPFASWLEQKAGLNNSPAAQWPAQLAQYVSDSGLPESVLSGLATLLGVPTEEPMGDAAAARHAAMEAVKTVLCARDGIVVCEDAHWADPSTLEVFNTLAEHPAQSTVLLLLSSRQAAEAAPDTDNPITEIALGAIDAQSAEAIVRDSAPVPLSDAACQSIIERASGLPMFIAELARQYDETAPDDNTGNAHDRSVPTSLRSLLLNQLERVGDAKRVAQEGSVLGHEFSYEDLAAISVFKGANLDTELVALEKANVLARTLSTSGSGYRFSHALMQAVAYESLLKKSRTQIHRRVANLMQDRAFPPPPDRKLISRLARHWNSAVADRQADATEIEKATQYLMDSAEASLSLSAYQEARSSLLQVIKLLKRLPESTARDELELKLHMTNSVVDGALDGFASPSVEADFVAARALCEKLGKRRELAQVLLSTWMLHLGRGQYAESLEAATASLTLTDEIDDSVIRLRALTAVANSEFWLGDLKSAFGRAVLVIDEYRPGCDPTGLIEHGWDAGVQAYMVAVWASWLLGHDNTLEFESRMQALTAELDHPINRSLLANTSAMLHILRRDGDAAVRAADDLITVANEFNLAFYKMFGDMFKAAGLVFLGRGDEGFEAADGIFQFYEANMGGLAQTFIASFMVLVYANQGQHERALAVAQYGVQAATQSNESVFKQSLERQVAVLTDQSTPSLDQLSICGDLLPDSTALSPTDPRNHWIA